MWQNSAAVAVAAWLSPSMTSFWTTWGFTYKAYAGIHLADLSSDLKSATGPRWVSLSGLTIELMLVI